MECAKGKGRLELDHKNSLTTGDTCCREWGHYLNLKSQLGFQDWREQSYGVSCRSTLTLHLQLQSGVLPVLCPYPAATVDAFLKAQMVAHDKSLPDVVPAGSHLESHPTRQGASSAATRVGFALPIACATYGNTGHKNRAK